MDTIYVFRERIQELYARYSRIIEKAGQFILAFAAFALINHQVGFLGALASPVAALGLAIICTFLPLFFTVIVATALILAHLAAVSLGILLVTAVVFLVMYIFYLRLTPKMSLLVLLTALAFFLKIPYAIPVACGLLLSPVSMVAVVCGGIAFYMLEYVRENASALEGSADLLTQVISYLQQVFQNKEMWIVIVAFLICCFVVYTLRRQAADHAWKIAIVAGAVVNIVVIAAGDIAFGVHTSYGSLVGGSIAAIVLGLILEIFFFAVDYSRSENLQYEDDEYYYYVKAVPKISIATPEKTVKKINERQETEIIDAEEVRRKARKRKDVKDVDKVLLTQSLKDDLGMK
ncbi:hypothetical protein [uncultured Merdimonas sp.]|uniref:hypothetical protein n=1 Tax=uncultured Merdimonas sp. TaxID=2023269 RepID=UPI0032087CEF